MTPEGGSLTLCTFHYMDMNLYELFIFQISGNFVEHRPLADEELLTEAGIDSLSAISFRNELSAQFGVRLPGTLVADHPTIAAVASYISEKAALERSAIEMQFLVCMFWFSIPSDFRVNIFKELICCEFDFEDVWTVAPQFSVLQSLISCYRATDGLFG